MSDNLYVSGSDILTAIGRAGDASAISELKESAGHLKFDTAILERNGDIWLPQKTIEELCYEVQTPFAGAAYDVLPQIKAMLIPLPAETAVAESPRSRRRAAPVDAASSAPAADPVARALAGLPAPTPAADAGATASVPAATGRGRGRGAAAAAATTAATTATVSSDTNAPEPQTAGQVRIQELRKQADTSVSQDEVLGDVKPLARLLLAMLKAQERVLEEILNAG